MSVIFTIVGSGFGLYGYLPALLYEVASRVVLPEMYKEKLSIRPELARYKSKIIWVSSFNQALSMSDGIVIASTPDRQFQILVENLPFEKIKYIFVEKPLAPSVEKSKDLLDNLLITKRKFRIGYTFLYTEWYQKLKSRIPRIGNTTKLVITWKFYAHHFAENLDNWKRYDLCGGGVINFYGIHVISILADLGYTDILESNIYEKKLGASESWFATFVGDQLSICNIEINSRSLKNEFSIKTVSTTQEIVHVDLLDPFQIVGCNVSRTFDGDRRAVVLQKLVKSIWKEDVPIYQLYIKINSLWEKAQQGG